MKKFFVFYTFLSAITACTQFSSEYKRTKQENDSLKLQILKSEAEVNDILSILNAVEEDIQSIRITEELLSIQKDSELSNSRREQLKNNIGLINETLKKNRLKLTELQEKLDASNIRFYALQKTIDRLTKDMNEKSELIVTLRKEIDKKEVRIEQLSQQIEELHADVKELEDINLSQVDLINEQDVELNTVYYCFGTKKELKEQSILTGGGIFSKSKTMKGDFNHEYFLAADKRTLTSIPLFSSKAAIKTNHPDGSYHFAKDSDGSLTLKIVYPSTFWSLSRFLVIEIK